MCAKDRDSAVTDKNVINWWIKRLRIKQVLLYFYWTSGARLQSYRARTVSKKDVTCSCYKNNLQLRVNGKNNVADIALARYWWDHYKLFRIKLACVSIHRLHNIFKNSWKLEPFDKCVLVSKLACIEPTCIELECSQGFIMQLLRFTWETIGSFIFCFHGLQLPTKVEMKQISNDLVWSSIFAFIY